MTPDRPHHYILINRVPVAVDMYTWADWLRTADRHVGRTMVGGIEISTVFMGLDHNFSGKGDALLFETMIFPDIETGEETYMTRCATYAEAEDMHRIAVALTIQQVLGVDAALRQVLAVTNDDGDHD
jgi:hypothetical protein